MKNYFILVFAFLLAYSSFAQTNMTAYEGNWEGNLPSKEAFNIELSIKLLKNQKYQLSISNEQVDFALMLSSKSPDLLQFDLWNGLQFNGVLSEDQSSISGFLKSGIMMYHIQLRQEEDQLYTGTWNILMVDQLQSPKVFLSVEDTDGENYVAYPFFKDQRFTGTWCTDFKKDGTTISWSDFKTGLQFKGQLGAEEIRLEAYLGRLPLTQVSLKKSQEDWQFGTAEVKANAKYSKPMTTEDGWPVADLETSRINEALLKTMADSIYANSITFTHSVLIAKDGALVYEKYFSDYNQNIPHDQRSAAKSLASALFGIAIRDKMIETVDQPLYHYVPKEYQYTKDSLKSDISIRHLLTMSSGIDAVDFGIDRQSKASENAYQNSPNWLKTVLEAPMINTPGEHANYGSANTYLLGIILNSLVDKPLEVFMDQKLFAPLGITNYVIQGDQKGIPYFGGGSYLTPRDMLKFGQLYINKGIWKGQRILSEDWVEQSQKNYLVLENTNNKNGYGFLWWHRTYEVNGQTIKSVEARGSGGQYIAVIPELDLVVAITSGNFRNGRFWQPEHIIEKYILPAVIN